MFAGNNEFDHRFHRLRSEAQPKNLIPNNQLSLILSFPRRQEHLSFITNHSHPSSVPVRVFVRVSPCSSIQSFINNQYWSETQIRRSSGGIT